MEKVLIKITTELNNPWNARYLKARSYFFLTVFITIGEDYCIHDSQIFLSLSLSLFGKKKEYILSVRTLLCNKWRYRPAKAHLHVRHTNLLSVTLLPAWDLLMTSLHLTSDSNHLRAENGLKAPVLVLPFGLILSPLPSDSGIEF